MLNQPVLSNGGQSLVRRYLGSRQTYFRDGYAFQTHPRGQEVVTRPVSGTSFERKQVVSESTPELHQTSAVPAEIDGDMEYVGRVRADGDAPSERPCMMCGTKFESEGWHNRLCGSCRKRSAPLG
jgi:hypothetical protein